MRTAQPQATFLSGPPSENHTLQCALESHHVFAVVDVHFAQRPQRIFQLLLTTGHGSKPPSCIQVLLENCTFVHSAQSCNLCFQFLATSTSLLVRPARRTSSYRSVVFASMRHPPNKISNAPHAWTKKTSSIFLFTKPGAGSVLTPPTNTMSCFAANLCQNIFSECKCAVFCASSMNRSHIVQQISIHGSSRVPAGQ